MLKPTLTHTPMSGGGVGTPDRVMHGNGVVGTPITNLYPTDLLKPLQTVYALLKP